MSSLAFLVTALQVSTKPLLSSIEAHPVFASPSQARPEGNILTCER